MPSRTPTFRQATSSRCVPADATVDEVARVMISEDVDALPVVEQDEPVAVVTDRDLIAGVLAKDLDPGETRVAEVVRKR